MDQYSKTDYTLELSRSKTVVYGAVWISAGIIGAVAVAFARIISFCQQLFFSHFNEHPLLVSLLGPCFFILATWIVRRLAPDAKGSGIPQVLAAIKPSKTGEPAAETWNSPLVSVRTAAVKVVSACFGILGGASIGREGPTIQIAASGFAWIGNRARKFAPELDFPSFVIAGAAAGVAAAFNTPIAGIAFAIEEIASNSFGAFKQHVMLAIIIAGLVAQSFSGDYLYFGQPEVIVVGVGMRLLQAVLIGLIGGFAGGFFAVILAKPQIAGVPRHWLGRAAVAGIICAAIGYFTNGETSGSGYEATEHILSHGTIQDVNVGYPIFKLLTTALSYLSGMAGGIFSPSLSIGSGVGLAMAKLFGWVNFKACALIGMVAFFSGAVGAPLTAIIIVMEMTNERTLVIPFMIAAYLAHMVGRRLMPIPLYHYLADKHLEG